MNAPLVESKRDERLLEMMKLSETITTIRDIMRKDVGIESEIQILEELAWLLFLKILDDRDRGLANSGIRSAYSKVVPERLQWRNWAPTSNGLTGEQLDTFVHEDLFPSLQNLSAVGEHAEFATMVRSVFIDVRLHVNTGTLQQIIDELDRVDFSQARTTELFASVYENLLANLFSTVLARVYFTPRPLVQFMVDVVNPKLGETILDPAFGTGGFLLEALDALRQQSKTTEDRHALNDCIRGFDKSQRAHLLAVVNLMLHGLDVPSNVVRKDALDEYRPNQAPQQHVDVIFADPPMGYDEPLLHMVLLQDWPLEIRRADDTTLFLLLISNLLKPGGRAAVIVPDGFLSGEGIPTNIKKQLMTECNWHTIVRLPKGAIASPVRFNLLFFTKGSPTREIWYYEHASSVEKPNPSKTNALRAEDFAPEKAWWHNRKENEFAWRIPIEDIRAQEYNLDIENPRRAGTSTSFRVEWLKLRSFRGFGALTLELPKQGPTVLIGINGAGKSTIIDAIVMHLSHFASLMRIESSRHGAVQLDKRDIKQGEKQAEVSVLVRIGEDAQVWDLKVPRPRGSGTAAKSLQGQVDPLLSNLALSDGASVPVLCFYPATRGAGDGPPTGGKRPIHRFPQLEAYTHAFGYGFGPFHDFEQWFRDAEDAENERRLRIDPAHRNRHLEVVRRAIQTFLTALDSAFYSNLRMERPEAGSGGKKQAELVLDKSGVRLSIGQLSEGEKNTLLLVADLASRFAIANPERDEPLQGDGVVLIDEVDLHLHPGWQRELLPALAKTFPGCQFIVSTHSAQVLGRVPKNNVFVLENFQILEHRPHTYGRDANSILGEVMGVPERPKDIEALIRKASLLVDEERLDEAKVALQELTNTLGDDDNMVVRIRTLAALLDDRD